MKLKVYYGWSKKNAVRKKRSISVMFENSAEECRNERGTRTLRALQDTCIERYQDVAEMEDAKHSNRIFTEYSLMLDEKPIDGSLEKILKINAAADEKHVGGAKIKEIAEALRKAFMKDYPDYQEPIRQLNLNFSD